MSGEGQMSYIRACGSASPSRPDVVRPTWLPVGRKDDGRSQDGRPSAVS